MSNLRAVAFTASLCSNSQSTITSVKMGESNDSYYGQLWMMTNNPTKYRAFCQKVSEVPMVLVWFVSDRCSRLTGTDGQVDY